jgi:Tfp pilus assembly protein PilV
MISRRFPLQSARSGFSLLEVLVACGILVVGLASVAAILPAAGSRLGEASDLDRAAAAAAVAMSEIRCRNLAARDMFPGSLSGTAQAIVFGETLPLAVTVTATSSGYASSSVAVTGTTLSVSGTNILSIPNTSTLGVGSRIHNDTTSVDRRGYFLEDQVQYLPSASGPRNLFATGTISGSGLRTFNRGVCWGAMVTPVPWGATTGSMTAAKVSVAVFRKPGGEPKAITLRLTSGSGFITTNNVPGAFQRSTLKSCSSLLALPPSGASSTGPQWLAVQSAWVAGTDPLASSPTTANVVFANPVPASLLSSGTLQVIGFENLLFVTEQILPIQ